MAEAKQLLPGFNHNVTRQGKLYHVQTEDSGTANPHVTTHLFLGGNVLAAKRTSYSDALGDAQLATRVRKLMEAQHKHMLRELVRGAFDEVEGERAAHARTFVPTALAAVEAANAVAPSPPPVTAAAPSPSPSPSPPPVTEPSPPPAQSATPMMPPVTAPPALPAAPPAAARPPPRPVDGWGPPMLARVHAPPSAAQPAGAPRADRRLDELILSYLAEDLGAKRER